MSKAEDETPSILDDGGVDTDARAGRSLGIDLTEPPDGMTAEEVEAERQRRLSPENRPEGAQVDNTDRTFDHERGQFTDSETFQDAEPRYADPEAPDDAGGQA